MKNGVKKKRRRKRNQKKDHKSRGQSKNGKADKGKTDKVAKGVKFKFENKQLRGRKKSLNGKFEIDSVINKSNVSGQFALTSQIRYLN